jgi:hypothetical protein
MDCGFIPGCKRSDRHIHCVVPHCQYTIGAKGDVWTEWVCAKHWAGVPRQMRKVLKRTRMAFKATGNGTAFSRIWRRCRREAINRAVGI